MNDDDNPFGIDALIEHCQGPSDPEFAAAHFAYVRRRMVATQREIDTATAERPELRNFRF